MPFNPFNSDGSSLEHDNPVVDVTKKTANAATTQTTQQVKASNQSFVDQLYGNVAPATDETDPTAQAVSQPKTPMSNVAASAVMQNTIPKTPVEQAQIDEARKRLEMLQHNKAYFDVTFGEEAQAKRRQEEEEERQAKLQEEEEEKQREADEKARQDEEMASFQQHGKGQNKLADPVAVTQAKTKTEINRGSTG